MRFEFTQWASRAVAVGAFAAFGASGMAAQSVSGDAFGAYVQTPAAAQAKTPHATLPSVAAGVGEMAEASGQGVAVPGALSSGLLTSVTTGARGAGKAGAQSIATVADVSVLNGLITAERVIAVVSTARSGASVISEANGSAFEGLRVNGVALPATPAPNTRMSLPGVGYVVLNEQVRQSGGITVNMIHVVLQSVGGGLLGGTVTTAGEIIVGSASSALH
jgi:hypothetical protein